MNAVRETALLVCLVSVVAGCAGVETMRMKKVDAAAAAPAAAGRGGPAPEAGGFTVTPPPASAPVPVLPELAPPAAASVSAPVPSVPARLGAPLPTPEPPRAAAAQPQARPASASASAVAARPSAAAQPPPAAVAAAAPPPAPRASEAAAPVATAAAERHQAYARRGDDVEVALQGSGWVFTGTSDPAVAEFRSRSLERSGTVFSFHALAAGTARLAFSRQDGAGRPAGSATVEVSVISPEEFSSRVERGESSPELPSEQKSFIDSLIEARQYDDALREITKLGGNDDAYRNDRTAFIQLARGDLRGARASWTKNAPRDESAQPDAMQARALSGLLRIAVLLDDYASVLRWLGPLRRGQFPAADQESQSLLAAAYLLGKANAAAAISVLDALADRRGGMPARRQDEITMLLARAYETDGPLRDVPRAQALYRRVYESYPDSSLAETARERAAYLERHILLVQ